MFERLVTDTRYKFGCQFWQFRQSLVEVMKGNFHAAIARPSKPSRPHGLHLSTPDGRWGNASAAQQLPHPIAGVAAQLAQHDVTKHDIKPMQHDASLYSKNTMTEEQQYKLQLCVGNEREPACGRPCL